MTSAGMPTVPPAGMAMTVSGAHDAPPSSDRRRTSRCVTGCGPRFDHAANSEPSEAAISVWRAASVPPDSETGSDHVAPPSTDDRVRIVPQKPSTFSRVARTVRSPTTATFPTQVSAFDTMPTGADHAVSIRRGKSTVSLIRPAWASPMATAETAIQYNTSWATHRTGSGSRENHRPRVVLGRLAACIRHTEADGRSRRMTSASASTDALARSAACARIASRSSSQRHVPSHIDARVPSRAPITRAGAWLNRPRRVLNVCTSTRRSRTVRSERYRTISWPSATRIRLARTRLAETTPATRSRPQTTRTSVRPGNARSVKPPIDDSAIGTIHDTRSGRVENGRSEERRVDIGQ